MVKRIAILGSTGSIGKNALRVIDALNSSVGFAAVEWCNGILKRITGWVDVAAF